MSTSPEETEPFPQPATHCFCFNLQFLCYCLQLQFLGDSPLCFSLVHSFNKPSLPTCCVFSASCGSRHQRHKRNKGRKRLSVSVREGAPGRQRLGRELRDHWTGDLGTGSQQRAQPNTRPWGKRAGFSGTEVLDFSLNHCIFSSYVSLNLWHLENP